VLTRPVSSLSVTVTTTCGRNDVSIALMCREPIQSAYSMVCSPGTSLSRSRKRTICSLTMPSTPITTAPSSVTAVERAAA